VSAPGEVASIRIASRTDVGRARRDNQDAYGEFASPAGERLVVVADGMGGHVGGATASRICVEALGAVLGETDGDPEERLRRGLRLANARILEVAAAQRELTGMGTTGVALLFGEGGRAWLGWVGDSRAYRLRGGVLEALSRDHSLVAEWVRAGLLLPEEAEQHPRRNELLRALGVAPEVEPEIVALEVRPGDQYLLCTDGLSAVVPLAEIADVVAHEPPELAAPKLVARANERGGPDNVTVAIAVVPDEAATALLAGRARAASPSTRGLRLLAALAAGLALALIAIVYYGLRHGGGGLPVVADDLVAPSHADVVRFLDDWSAAANARDGGRLQSLGFELSPERLARDFPGAGGKLDLVLLAEQPVAEDQVGLRLRLVYTEPVREGVERREEERAIVLRSQDGRLRYAGDWQ